MEMLLTVRQPLFPADTGGKVRSLNIFSRLARRASIDVVSFADIANDQIGISQMKAIFNSYTPVPWREAEKHSTEFYKEVLLNQFSRMPYSLAKCNRTIFRVTVEALLARKHYDLIFCDFIHTAVPLLGLGFKPKVMFQHNVEFLLRKRKWEVEKRPIQRWIFNNEWRRMRAVEAKVCRSFDHVITVSDEDERTLRHEFGIEKTSTLPTGVDTDYFSPSTEGKLPKRLVFIGSMDWDPNEDGVIWFLREIYPLIRKSVPDISFSIVGRNPSSRLRGIVDETPGVELTGRVPDVRPYLAAAEVVVVPLRVGGGTRIKIPEAMAMAKPIVSTPIGAEGLPFQGNREICIAEQPEEFAQSVITLLEYPLLRKAIGSAARKTVVDNHSWNAVVDKLEQTLGQVTRDRRGLIPHYERQTA